MPSLTRLPALKDTFPQNHSKNLGPKLKTRVCQPPVLLFKASTVTVIRWLVDVVVKDIDIGAGGLGFDSWVGQIGQSVGNDSPPVQLFCVA